MSDYENETMPVAGDIEDGAPAVDAAAGAGEPAVRPAQKAPNFMDGIADDDPHYERVCLPDLMGKSYVDYAMSVIVARALPDVRDGFKPVHRRIMYAMYKAGITHNVPYRKCATTVGDVLGHFHPHGDASVYDALARLAQDFSMRYPLVDGHGNFGSMDGDPPAAYRYCVSGDTLVATDSGLRRIGEIAGATDRNTDNPIAVRVKSKGHATNPASMLFNSGLHPVYRVDLYGGFNVCATGNHPLLVLDDEFRLAWRTVDDLVVGDKVVVDLDTSNAMFGTNGDILEARMLGAMMSRGYATTGDRMGVSECGMQTVKPVKSFFESRYGVSSDVRVEGEGRYGYCVADPRHYSEFVRKYGLDRPGLARVPDCVFEGTREYVAEFLSNLYEGGGSVAYADDIFHKDVVMDVSYPSKSRQFVEDLQRILAMQFGILAFVSHDANRDLYVLSIAPRSFCRFADEIGFVSDGKNEVLSRLADRALSSQFMNSACDTIDELDGFVKRLNHGIRRSIVSRRDFDMVRGHVPDDKFDYAADLLDSYAFLPVMSIADAGLDTVYSVRVDSVCHSFSGNGFINHNTEARMAPFAGEMLRDIDKDTVDWEPNFDGRELEPSVLPARFPNLLVNGSQGIAVGMACNIPPHNLGEVVDAAVLMIENDLKGKDTGVSELLDIVQGPDFPTGAVILGRDYRDVYLTGRGTITLEAVHDIETVGKRQQIVFTEIPYQVNKKTLVEDIAKYCREKKLDVADVRDESSREGVRVVVELKRSAIPELVLNNLLQHTKLRTNFSANMLALVDGRPMTLNLAQMLRYYLDHQMSVLSRRTVYEKAKAEKRLHIVEGLIKATDDLDAVIDAIRNCLDDDDPKQVLMDGFGFDDVQAQVILDMRLRSLTGLERKKLEGERDELVKEIARCGTVLSDRPALLKLVRKELKDVRRKYADDRRTKHREDYLDITMEDLVEDEPCVVIRTNMGYLKRMKPGSFRLQKKGGKGSHVATLSNDYIEDMISASTLSDIFFFTNFGKVYTMKAYQIAETARTSRGTAMVSVLTKLQSGESVTGMIVEEKDGDRDGRYLMMITKNGVTKRVAMSELPRVRSNGLIVIRLDEGDEVRSTLIVEDGDNVMVTTKNGYCAAYAVFNVRPMGRPARGVKGITLADGDEVVAMQRQEPGREIMIITSRGYAKRVACGDFTVYKGRTARGVRCIKPTATEKIGDVSKAFLIEDPSNDLMITMDNGQIIKTPIDKVPVYSRAAQGARMLNLSSNPDGVVADVVATIHEEPCDGEDDIDGDGDVPLGDSGAGDLLDESPAEA